VSCVGHSEDVGVFSAGWDKTIRQWDSRAATEVEVVALPDKAYAMAVSALYVVVGTADRHVLLYDIRKMGEVLETRESSLKRQTRCIRMFPDETGYAMGSVEGRVAIEYISEAQQNLKYAFKCHRVVASANSPERLYPVNALAFHPWYGTFASGGADRTISVWDGQNKKRLAYYKYPSSIAALAFNHTGSILAVASSYTFEEGENPTIPHGPNAVYLRHMQDHEVRPKSKDEGAKKRRVDESNKE